MLIVVSLTAVIFFFISYRIYVCEFNNAVDGGPLLFARATTVDTNDTIHEDSSSISSVCCVFVANLFV